MLPSGIQCQPTEVVLSAVCEAGGVVLLENHGGETTV